VGRARDAEGEVNVRPAVLGPGRRGAGQCGAREARVGAGGGDQSVSQTGSVLGCKHGIGRNVGKEKRSQYPLQPCSAAGRRVTSGKPGEAADSKILLDEGPSVGQLSRSPANQARETPLRERNGGPRRPA